MDTFHIHLPPEITPRFMGLQKKEQLRLLLRCTFGPLKDDSAETHVESFKARPFLSPPVVGSCYNFITESFKWNSYSSKNESFYFSLWLHYLIALNVPAIQPELNFGAWWTVKKEDDKSVRQRRRWCAPFGDFADFPSPTSSLGNLLPSVVSIIHKLSNKSNLFNLI